MQEHFSQDVDFGHPAGQTIDTDIYFQNDAPAYKEGTDNIFEVAPPRFMNQTFSQTQMALGGSYSEAERVRNSFRTGSFWSLKKLPAKIEPGEVSKLRTQQTTKNLMRSSPPKGRAVNLSSRA